MLYRKIQIENKEIAIWKISESLTELRQMAKPNDFFDREIDNLHSEKR